MGSTFFGLEIGNSALQAQKAALDVTGHNIANSNTKGYSRQEAVLAAKNPYTVPGLNRPSTPGQVGTGVEVQQIRRLRDSFIDNQVRTETKNLGYWEAKEGVFQKIEAIINEPSDSGLSSVLDQFWQGWEDLSKNPESLAVRSVVRQRGIAVADAFNHMDQLYRELRTDLNDNIKTKVNEVNSIAQQIAEINVQIMPIEAVGDKANDLRDKRDLLIDQLSKIADVRVSENNLGQVNVTLGTRQLVYGEKVSLLKYEGSSSNSGYVDVKWAEDGQIAQFSGGELKGLIESRDVIIPGLRGDLDTMAKTLVEEVNTIHQGGYDLNGDQNLNFFKPFDSTNPPNGQSFAQAIQLTSDILGGLDKIAAGNEPKDANGNPVVGDGGNALEIAQLKHTNLVDLNGTGSKDGTIDDFYRAQLGKLGVNSQEATRMTDNQQMLVDQLENRRASVSGVSLDEEMTNMMKFQHGYNAAARVITVMDQMLDKIINGMGATR